MAQRANRKRLKKVGPNDLFHSQHIFIPYHIISSYAVVADSQSISFFMA